MPKFQRKTREEWAETGYTYECLLNYIDELHAELDALEEEEVEEELIDVDKPPKVKITWGDPEFDYYYGFEIEPKLHDGQWFGTFRPAGHKKEFSAHMIDFDEKELAKIRKIYGN